MVLFAGIDYGSKLAGTTAIAWQEDGKMQLLLSEKKKDADVWLLDVIVAAGIQYIFIDAPLSLPIVYTQPNMEGDYFYRDADRITGAMSPMFLGGLTARAMRLSRQLQQVGVQSTEVYPAHLKRVMGEDWLAQLAQSTGVTLDEISASNNHQQDALLAWLSGWRWHHHTADIIGDPKEGQIVI